MGDINQVAFLQKFVPVIDGPVLEVGSKQYGSTSSFRDFYAGNDYVGVDVEPGPGVDLVCDLTKELPGALARRFALCICTSVLEHIDKPWLAAASLESCLRPRGLLYLAVPWVWRYHPYPDDYFRFSPRGVRALFEGIDFFIEMYSTNVPGEFVDLSKAPISIDDSFAVLKDCPRGPRKYLPYLQVLTIGRKQEQTG